MPLLNGGYHSETWSWGNHNKIRLHRKANLSVCHPKYVSPCWHLRNNKQTEIHTIQFFVPETSTIAVEQHTWISRIEVTSFTYRACAPHSKRSKSKILFVVERRTIQIFSFQSKWLTSVFTKRNLSISQQKAKHSSKTIVNELYSFRLS